MQPLGLDRLHGMGLHPVAGQERPAEMEERLPVARVDGRDEIAVPIGPLFVGVPIPAGTHEVALVYHAPAYKSWLLAAGALVLLSIAVKRRQVEAAIDRLPLPRG